MYAFKANHGMRKRSFHIVDSLSVHAIDLPGKKLIKCSDALALKRFAQFKEGGAPSYLTRDKYIVVSVTQNGFKTPTYNSIFAIELGGDFITTIKSYGAVISEGSQELHFEALGRPLKPHEIQTMGFEFILKNARTAPKQIEDTLVSVKPTKAHQNRGIAIIKNGGADVLSS